jgi:hypothetical protein
MKIVTLYESASTDGYTATGDRLFYLDQGQAQAQSRAKHGGYSTLPLEHSAVATEDGRYLLLKSTRPVSLAGSTQAVEDLAASALKKLTTDERRALGLTVPEA